MKLFTQTTLMMTLVGSALLTACGQAPQMPLQPMQIQQNVQSMTMQNAESRQLLIRFHTERDMTDSESFRAKYGLHVRAYLPQMDLYIVDIDETIGLKSAQIIGYLMNDPMIAFAEINQNVQVSPIF